MSNMQLYAKQELVNDPRCKLLLAELGQHRFVYWTDGERELIRIHYDYAPALAQVFAKLDLNALHNQGVGLKFDFRNRKLHVKLAKRIVSLNPDKSVRLSTLISSDGILLHVDTGTGRVAICDDELIFDVDGESIESFTVDLFDTPVRIVCAANRYRDPEQLIDRTVLGVRHLDAFMHETLENTDFRKWDRGEIEEGFVDQRGNFYTRQQAWYVAECNNQILRRVGGDTTDGGTLYSENLY